ncbi:hypothetical protein [Campylobacter troglodytis]|uniref:hypothetical protein n=1 Tax=Campylobacter troglodytis TaxID=654363 RepID=UPI00115BA3B4|nr:hypothetical protein [Campylobacter troglodytis]TQR61606.1 hypothetical protein DMC01_00085 [Campylobacter troglodytis]
MRIIFILLLSFLLLNANELKWHELDNNQKRTAKIIYRMVEDKDERLALIAIAFQESKLGKFPINIQDPSCGAFHILLPTYLNTKNIIDSSYNRNVHCSELINDTVLSTKTALEILHFWKSYHRGNLENAIKSYNTGFNFNSPQANAYLKNVKNNIQIILELVQNGTLR